MGAFQVLPPPPAQHANNSKTCCRRNRNCQEDVDSLTGRAQNLTGLAHRPTTP